ncbi:hypothetical protein U9M48_017331 [Paspalum notatum var. saurae]|uniref:WRKY domain-containing protein n=1 Tax=Paspalum notatum var. saurae TaxID=547442 RepID=A0AAQ3T8M6_PASNO
MTLDAPAAVVLELMTMGQQSAAHLGDLLRAASPASPQQDLAAEILRCCGRVIDALKAAAAASGPKRKAAEYYQETAAAAGSPPPPGPPPPKRRSRGAEAIKEVTSGTTVDGFIWRKYGQKDINGHRHPRLYYRCAHKSQGCAATRRVQRTRDQPAEYEIAYYGEHTCRGAWQPPPQGGAPPPTVVDFGSNSVDASPPASMSQGGWSSASSEVGFEFDAQEWWHDTAAAEEQQLVGGAAPGCYAPDPVMEFLDGCGGWEAVLGDPLDLGGLQLQDFATFQ